MFVFITAGIFDFEFSSPRIPESEAAAINRKVAQHLTRQLPKQLRKRRVTCASSKANIYIAQHLPLIRLLSYVDEH